MAYRRNGTEVDHSDALLQWASVAYAKLREVARTYNEVIDYTTLSQLVQAETGLATDMLVPHWIGKVLEIAAKRSSDAQEPPLTSLCVHADGTIGPGYEDAPKYDQASSEADIELRAAEDRLLCYRRYATDLPPDGGTATLTPEVALKRRRDSPNGGSTPWLDQLVEVGSLAVADRVPFHDHLEVGRLFGRSYKGHQSATIRLDEFTEVWFPKMYPNDDWNNSLSSDGEVITMRHVPGGKYGAVMVTKPIREYVITFGHIKPATGPRYYMFLGVFEGAPHLSDNTKWVHQRVADTICFDGHGDVTFASVRSRPVQDDQAAEAAHADPKLVAKYQEQLDSGSYSVDDQVGASKSRGSAQAVFAKAVKGNYGWECAVTGIKTKAFLVASHIVPWSEAKDIRLDPTNGVCLSTFVDRAFDAGYLAITPEGRTAVRWAKLENDPILKLELSKIDDVELAKPTVTPPDPAKLARRIELGY